MKKEKSGEVVAFISVGVGVIFFGLYMLPSMAKDAGGTIAENIPILGKIIALLGAGSIITGILNFFRSRD